MDRILTDKFRKTIIEDSLKVFKTHGVSAISMAEMAQKLGISATTLKEISETKEDLFRKAVINDMADNRKRQQEIISASANPVDQLMNLLKLSMSESRDLSPAYLADFMTFPDLWEIIEKEIEEYSVPLYHGILNNGIRAGVFRKDINIDIVTKVIIQNLYVLLNFKVFPPERYSTGEIMRNIYLYYFRGLCEADTARTVDNYFSK